MLRWLLWKTATRDKNHTLATRRRGVLFQQGSSPLLLLSPQKSINPCHWTVSPSKRAASTIAAPQSLFGPSFYSFARYRTMELPSLTQDPASWKGSSLLSVNQITAPGLHLLFHVTHDMRTLVRTTGGDARLSHRLMSTVFYEASTRTACSFQAAMARLGGRHIHVDGKGGNSSAAKKGESLEDTILCLECYADVTVLRHPLQGSVGRVMEVATKPILNAGDGVGEHPTQALLDVFTIYDELKLSEGPKPLVVVLLGDLKHGRTVHSLAKLLAVSQIWKQQLVLRYCAPQGLEMPDYIKEFVDKVEHVKQETCDDLVEACRDADVLYVTRVQKERFATEQEYERLKGSYVVNNSTLEACKNDMIVLHPLPRVDEIAKEVDADPRAAYFRQMENGMFVRMAILALVLGKPSGP